MESSGEGQKGKKEGKASSGIMFDTPATYRVADVPLGAHFAGLGSMVCYVVTTVNFAFFAAVLLLLTPFYATLDNLTETKSFAIKKSRIKLVYFSDTTRKFSQNRSPNSECCGTVNSAGSEWLVIRGGSPSFIFWQQ